MRLFTDEELQVVIPAHIEVAGALLESRAAGTHSPESLRASRTTSYGCG